MYTFDVRTYLMAFSLRLRDRPTTLSLSAQAATLVACTLRLRWWMLVAEALAASLAMWKDWLCQDPDEAVNVP